MSTKLRPLSTLTILLCLVMVCVVLAQQEAEFRMWTDATGKFKLEAAFEKSEDGKVHLKRKDNDKMIVLPTKNLSKDDQAYVRKLQADRAKAAKASGKPKSNATDKSAGVERPTGPLSWQGSWNNRKFGTEGMLRCTATVKDDKTWEAKFEGTGLGRPFTYDVVISTTKRGERTLLEGTSMVDGDSYQWTGEVQDGMLIGRYRSASGNNGEFRLQAPREQNASKRS